MFNNFNELIDQTIPISDKIIYIERILFDEYKLLEKIGFCINYSLISDSTNIDAINALECISNNKIDEIKNEKILNFIKLNR